MNIKPWSTILDGVNELYFSELHDTGKVRFVIKDKDGTFYEVLIPSSAGPYLISDEEYLDRYTFHTSSSSSRTFEIENSDLLACIVNGTHLSDNNLRHFVVTTYDACLEVFCDNEPQVRKLNAKEITA